MLLGRSASPGPFRRLQPWTRFRSGSENGCRKSLLLLFNSTLTMSSSPPNFSHRWLIIILLVSLSINTIGIGWGIPNKNDEWPVDTFNPVAAMAITKRAFLDEPW